MANDPWCFNPSCGELGDLDVTGWRVEAADGPVGEVDAYSDVTGEAFLVVEADGWIFGKVMIPAGAVTRLDSAGRTLQLDLSRGQIEDAPQYLPDQHRADPEYRAEIAECYWKTGPCEGACAAPCGSRNSVTAKDFRTWYATVLAAVAPAVSQTTSGASRARRGRVVARAVREVSDYLGNTPAVCRASYIDPRVIGCIRGRGRPSLPLRASRVRGVSTAGRPPTVRWSGRSCAS